MRRLVLLLLACTATGCRAVEHWYFTGESVDHAWGYEGDVGPDRWAELSPEYRLAAEGLRQSPIDLSREAPVSADAPSLVFRYHATDAHWVNNGHTLQHDEHDDNHVLFEGVRYDLAQYHVHTPSEHTVDGFHAACEMHFVHRDANGRVLVVGLLFVEGDDHQELLDNLSYYPEEEGGETDLPSVQDPLAIIPEDRSFWWYDGSFTTPPCTEGVQWIVLREPVQAPERLLRHIGAILGRNNRPVQPLNDRVVHASG